MTKLLACIDGSLYADSVCAYAAWFAKPLEATVDILHVLRRHSDYQSSSDLSGSIGLGARSELLEELTCVDEQRGKLDQQKGKLILEHGKKILSDLGLENVETLHRRGALVETIQELETAYDMLFVGKRGEHANTESQYLGSNLEKVARGVHKPLFVVNDQFKPIERILIAYDGKSSTQKAVDFMADRPSLSHLECHLLAVQSSSGVNLSSAETKLTEVGYKVISHIEQSSSVDKTIAEYVVNNQIDCLAIGAYSHSPLHNLLLGSTTASLITSCKVPILLFR